MSRWARGVREPHADSTPESLLIRRSSGRSLLILGLSLLLVASCASSSLGPTTTPAATPGPTATPPPTPLPAPTPPPPVTEDQLAAACAGTPIPGAAAYSGSLHPLVVNYVDAAGDWAVDNDKYADYFYPINAKWHDETWPGAIQLVLCVPSDKDVKACSKSLPDPGSNPPWRIYGDDPSNSTINRYAVAVSTQSTK